MAPDAVAAGKRRISQRCQNEIAAGGANKVWQEVSALARQAGVIDLGQGYPDFEGSAVARQSAIAALQEKDKALLNQYSPIPGLPALSSEIAAIYKRLWGQELDPQQEVLVTSSATEGVYACMQAFLDPGDECVFFEPHFPWYPTSTRMASGVPKAITLSKDNDFRIQEDVLDAALSSGKAKVLIINSPHNPTGHVMDQEEMDIVARQAKKHDVIVIADDAYEGQVFTGHKGHIKLAQMEGMWERTVTLGTASKMFSLTGWRVGWVTGPQELISALRIVHAYSTFCAPTPLQYGVAEALKAEDGSFDNTPERMAETAKMLCDALTELGLPVTTPRGGYFIVADLSSTGLTDMQFIKALIQAARVACTPMSVFYTSSDAPNNLVRFAICKNRQTIVDAIQRLNATGLEAILAKAAAHA
uniref:Aminotransferase class I/classII large domain-containing protein n=1 Tax=Tetraselmis chuii TaxID=63592 RepID=A0A7S1XAJ8_9CHLO|mmetsp:Transcript_7460/g.13457  ORF Transcript_7460/g.13457 Transcript_7460/m.13457 type:complete len:417 (+) Transcript_7460:164-1414(+)